MAINVYNVGTSSSFVSNSHSYAHLSGTDVDATAYPGFNGGNQFSTAVYWGNEVFLVPNNAPDLVSINVKTETITRYPVPNGSGANKSGGAMIAENKLFIVPQTYAGILVFDLETREFSTIGSTSYVQAYSGAARDPINGYIYSMPYNASQILRIDPVNLTATTVGHDFGTAAQKFSGTKFSSKTRKVFGIPRTGSDVVPIHDPSTETTDVTSITGFTGTNKFTQGCEAPNDDLYVMPGSVTYALIIDVDNLTTDTTSITHPSFTNFISPKLFPNGKIYTPETGGDTPISIAIIDPSDNSLSLNSITLPGSSRLSSLCVTNQGFAVGAPERGSNAMKIFIGRPTIPLEWCVSEYVNN